MEIANVTIELLLFLFIIAFVAGFLDTLAGGGGLISLPALIISGVPPLSALGTNKLQGSMGTATATYMMLRTKEVYWENVKYLMLSAFLGSLLGTIAVQFIDTKVLDFVIPTVLLLIAGYFIVVPQLNSEESKPRISKSTYQKIIVPTIGWYDGMFGPGTGSFYALSGMSLRGHGLINATAVAKTLNFSTNIASLFIFVMAGKVIWVIGMVMMVGQFAGAWGGSRSLLKINPQYLRILVVVMCMGMLCKYAFSMGWFTF